MAIQEGSGNVPPQSFERWNDPRGTLLASINRDGTITTTGVYFLDGTEQTTAVNTVNNPVVQAKLDVFDTTTTHSLSFTATVTTMYTVSIYMESEGDGLSTDTVVGTLTFSEDGSLDTHTITCTLHGGVGVENIVLETYPVLCEAGTVITFSTAFGAGVMTHDLSVRLVQMP